MISSFTFSSMIAAVIALLSAAPSIQFDTKTFQCGLIIEGKDEIVKEIFNVENKGEAVLKLENVRPSCGCIVVRYDTVIQPGKTARIESFMNTNGFHSGPVTKGITVFSNAKNEPVVRLTIKAVFQAHVDVFNSYLCFNESRNNKDTLYLATEKKDFKILGAQFRFNCTTTENAGWQTNLPVAITVKELPSDTIRSDGYKIFCFELVSPLIKQSQGGNVAIMTNHPEKPEITIQATLLK